MPAPLVRLWQLPWPSRLRLLAEPVIMNPLVQRLAVPHFMIGVVGLIRDADNRVLLLQHTYRFQYPWGLPTGFMQHREQPADALRREIREETRLKVELAPVWRVYTDPKRPLINVVFPGTVVAGTFAPSVEVSHAHFFARSDLPHLLPDQRLLIEAYLDEKGLS